MFRELEAEARRYLGGRSALVELEAWIAAYSQRIMDSGERRAIRLANQVDADLIDLGENIIDEAQFRARLHGHLAAEAGSAETVELGADDGTAAVTTTGTSSGRAERFSIKGEYIHTDIFEESFS